MTKPKFLAAGFLVLCLAGVCSSQAGTKTWTAAAGDWFVNANWGGNPYPTNGDDVVITNAGAVVLLTNSTAYLVSLTLSKTLVFSNWNTKLSATNITIQPGGTVSLPSAFTDTQMSNNVYFVCSNLTVSTGGVINVDGQGWISRYNANGFGPGAGTGGDGAPALMGAGHGGYGGHGGSSGSANGLTCGVSSAPILPGSSGGGGNAGWGGTGGSGGGAVRITAEGTVTVNGMISANGGNSSGNAGGGSGGSIYITCGVLTGTTGVIRANGGNDGVGAGGGGGGRIALMYNTNLQPVVPLTSLQLQVAGATNTIAPGDVGTLYFPDTKPLGEMLAWSGTIMIPGFTNWSVNNLTISNGWIRFPQDGFNLTVSNNLVLDGSAAWLQVGAAAFSIINITYTPMFSGGLTASVVRVGRNLTLTNGACLYLYGAATNAGPSAFGALVSVAGTMYVCSNSWVYPQSHPTNGGSVNFYVRNLYVEGGASGGFNADSRGYAGGTAGRLDGWGPGAGRGPDGGWAGGSYGGLGGSDGVSGGPTYGSSNAPAAPGSSGKRRTLGEQGGLAGGLVWISATGTVDFDGTITAKGRGVAWGGGGGSGGGIFIRCKIFVGSTSGSLYATGGSASYGATGGGGGGRIAVWRVRDQSSGAVTCSVSGGPADNGAVAGSAGTLVWGWMPESGTIISGR